MGHDGNLTTPTGMTAEPTRHGFRAVGLFSGIGGLEAGLHRAGHKTLLMAENDNAALAVLKHRLPEIQNVGDVRNLRSVPPETELLFGGFPCQDLSQAGETIGINGHKSSIVGEVFRLLRTTRVPFVVLENVPFMLQLGRGEAIRHIVAAFEELGYRWAYRVIDSRAFGLPQRRERVFLLASTQVDPAGILLHDDAGPAPEIGTPSSAYGFYWTEGSRGLGWAVDAVPTLKGGSTIGIPSPPAIWLPDGRIVTPDIRDAERLQGFDADWTLAARCRRDWKGAGTVRRL
jgi:DNA (cytosine-5)-methyltransferase 1